MPVPTPTPPSLRPILSSSSPSASAPTRRPTAGDRLTVDPDDRRRRARTALLELAVARTVERRRVI
ncbi:MULTISPECIES: hypothetical protein [unclassified Isoptericola]|uniref:hypothetical protein n=1 Tax=Isoptericola sp. NPDC057191 TaxID=3346041 RepID=UPI00362C4AC4